MIIWDGFRLVKWSFVSGAILVTILAVGHDFYGWWL